MTQLSFPWPDTTDPGPQIGDGRAYTDAEWDEYFEALHAGMRSTLSGIVRCWNELAVTSPGANTLAVSTGKAIVKGKYYTNDSSVTLTPASAAPGTSRKDSVVLEVNWTGGGSASQYTVRLAVKQGTPADYPSMTQTDNTLWQLRLYNYVISDTGAISGITRTARFLEPGVSGWVPLGSIIMWSGTLGGADNHYPVVDGVVDTAWHLCNGETVEGLVTPDLRDRFIVASGATYAIGDTGGAASVNLQHAHTNANESSHTHASGSIATGNESSHTHAVGTLATAAEASHTHNPGTLATTTSGAHAHTTDIVAAHTHTASAAASHAHGLSTGIASAVTASRQKAAIDASGNYVVRGWPSPSDYDYHSHPLAGNTSEDGGHEHTIYAAGGHGHSIASSGNHSHSLTGATAAGSSHNHGVTGSTAAGSAHSHGVSGSTAAGSAHSHAMDNRLSATQDVRPPYYALAFLLRVQ